MAGAGPAEVHMRAGLEIASLGRTQSEWRRQVVFGSSDPKVDARHL